MTGQTMVRGSRQQGTSVPCSVMRESALVMANERAFRKQSTPFREYFVFSFIRHHLSRVFIRIYADIMGQFLV